MTARAESMPRLSQVVARWDLSTRKVRYFASFDGQANDAIAPNDADNMNDEEWVEIPAEDVDRLTRLFAQEAIDLVCQQIYETIDDIKIALQDFSVFREGFEMAVKARTEPDN